MTNLSQQITEEIKIMVGLDNSEEQQDKCGCVIELAEILAKKATGRIKDKDITCFDNNFGIGIQFAAVGAIVFNKAIEKGIGKNLPVEWFTQPINP